jgi:beta-lactamase regulating signal transducer with metallopeptidase domain
VMEPVLLGWVESGARVAASAFVSGMWQGVVLAACVGLCLRLVPRTTAAVRFAVWSAVFVVLALLPFLHGVQAQGATAERGAMVHALHVDVRWSFAIAAVWLMLSGVRAAALMIGAVRLRKIWKRAAPVETGLAAEILRVGSGRRAVQICTSSDVDCPSVIGFFSPRVLVPVEMFERLAVPELEQIVLHEMGHLRRGDDWINLLQKIGLVLFPLNPALTWIERRLCFERELACDDGVLRLTKAPKAYAMCLTTLAERRLERRALALTLGAWERQSELSRRVYRILRRSEGMSRMQGRMVATGLMAVLLSGAAGLSRCPQFVSFSRTAAPMSAEAENTSAPSGAGEYRPVAFHPTEGSHETLLKASMPIANRASMQSERTARPQLRRTHRPALQRARKIRRGTAQQWVVLTSWAGSRDARMMMTVSQEQTVSPPQVLLTSYAAVPTVDGWLVFQL